MSKTVKTNQDSKGTKKTGVKRKVAKKAPAKVASKIRVYTNEYDIQMVEITAEPRNQFISLNKAKDILRTNTVPNSIKSVKFKGRDMFEITRENGKSFHAGQNKISAVLDNATELHAVLSGLEA